MKSHTEILKNIWSHKDALEKSLGLPYVWIRSQEYVIDNITGEKADLIFQDAFDPYKCSSDVTCYVLELKRDKGDHELLGQIKKYMDAMEAKSKYGHWGSVKGIAVAKEFTESCLKLLWKAKIRTFIYSEDRDGLPILTECKIKRRAAMTEQHMELIRECSI